MVSRDTVPMESDDVLIAAPNVRHAHNWLLVRDGRVIAFIGAAFDFEIKFLGVDPAFREGGLMELLFSAAQADISPASFSHDGDLSSAGAALAARVGVLYNPERTKIKSSVLSDGDADAKVVDSLIFWNGWYAENRTADIRRL